MPKKRPEPPNLTTKILEQIRDGIDATRAELVAAIGQTNDRVDAVERRLTATELRLSTQHAEILAALEEIRDDLKAGFARDAAINDLDERVTALEKAARQ